jgi:hypothetical protein
MDRAKGPVITLVERLAGRLRFPQLFLVTLVLFLADLLIPDLIPFVDEILLGLATLILARWKDRRDPPADPDDSRDDGQVIDVTPEH